MVTGLLLLIFNKHEFRMIKNNHVDILGIYLLPPPTLLYPTPPGHTERQITIHTHTYGQFEAEVELA